MQFTTIFVTLFATAGVMGYAPPPPPKDKPTKNIQPVNIQCGSQAGAYCCAADNSGTTDTTQFGSKDASYKCSKLNNVCNTIIICCSNVQNGGSQGTGQTCAGLAGKVTFE